MSEEEKTQTGLNFDGKDYAIEDLTAEQRHVVGHINDLQQKLGDNRVVREQLEAGQAMFISSLRESFAAAEAAEKTEEPPKE